MRTKEFDYFKEIDRKLMTPLVYVLKNEDDVRYIEYIKRGMENEELYTDKNNVDFLHEKHHNKELEIIKLHCETISEAQEKIKETQDTTHDILQKYGTDCRKSDYQLIENIYKRLQDILDYISKEFTEKNKELYEEVTKTLNQSDIYTDKDDMKFINIKHYEKQINLKYNCEKILKIIRVRLETIASMIDVRMDKETGMIRKKINKDF